MVPDGYGNIFLKPPGVLFFGEVKPTAIAALSGSINGISSRDDDPNTSYFRCNRFFSISTNPAAAKSFIINVDIYTANCDGCFISAGWLCWNRQVNYCFPTN